MSDYSSPLLRYTVFILVSNFSLFFYFFIFFSFWSQYLDVNFTSRVAFIANLGRAYLFHNQHGITGYRLARDVMNLDERLSIAARYLGTDPWITILNPHICGVTGKTKSFALLTIGYAVSRFSGTFYSKTYDPLTSVRVTPSRHFDSCFQSRDISSPHYSKHLFVQDD